MKKSIFIFLIIFLFAVVVVNSSLRSENKVEGFSIGNCNVDGSITRDNVCDERVIDGNLVRDCEQMNIIPYKCDSNGNVRSGTIKCNKDTRNIRIDGPNNKVVCA